MPIRLKSSLKSEHTELRLKKLLSFPPRVCNLHVDYPGTLHDSYLRNQPVILQLQGTKADLHVDIAPFYDLKLDTYFGNKLSVD